jgi:tetratricopeptide (TPR) repeat protein
LGYSTMTDFDFLSDDFDIDTYLAQEEKREEIQQLDQLATDCRDELQYAKAEKFYQRAADLAAEINDLSLLIKERLWLAEMQRMQGKHQAALEVFTWLIGVAYDPEQSRKLDEDDLWYVAIGFMDFVEVGRFLPEMTAADLERVIDRGLDWLAGVGKRNWSAGLRLNQGQLWKAQGKLEAALSEMEAALALCRRNPEAPGYTLGAHLYELGDLLQEMDRMDAAVDAYKEVAEGNEFDGHDQLNACGGLANVALTQQELAKAETYALKSLEMAREIESLEPIFNAYDVLGSVYWQQERVSEGINMAIQVWRCARQLGQADRIAMIYINMSEIRIYQAKQSNPQRYIPRARRWLRWAYPLAVRLDRQVGLTKRQDIIRELQAECDSLLP